MFIAEKNCVTLQNSMKWVHFRNVSRPVVGDGCDRQNVEQEGPWSAGDQQHHLPSEKRSTTLKDPSIWLAVLKNFKWLLLPWPLFRLCWLEQCGVVSLKKWIIEEVLLACGRSFASCLWSNNGYDLLRMRSLENAYLYIWLQFWLNKMEQRRLFPRKPFDLGFTYPLCSFPILRRISKAVIRMGMYGL